MLGSFAAICLFSTLEQPLCLMANWLFLESYFLASISTLPNFHSKRWTVIWDLSCLYQQLDFAFQLLSPVVCSVHLCLNCCIFESLSSFVPPPPVLILNCHCSWPVPGCHSRLLKMLYRRFLFFIPFSVFVVVVFCFFVCFLLAIWLFDMFLWLLLLLQSPFQQVRPPGSHLHNSQKCPRRTEWMWTWSNPEAKLSKTNKQKISTLPQNVWNTPFSTGSATLRMLAELRHHLHCTSALST